MKMLMLLLSALLGLVPAGEAFLRPLQPRDSVLVADQLSYGFRLDSMRTGTFVGLPDFTAASNDTLTLVRGWQLDTTWLKGHKKAKDLFSLEGSIVLAPFEEGTYILPDIPILRKKGASVDTLIFKGLELEVKTIPIDTATFRPHDLKGQIRYPLTFGEVAPWVAGALALAALLALGIWYARRQALRRGGASARKDPAYIVALRELEKYRGDKYWAPEKQKTFYSGITDALKVYMEERFGVDAPEMTTAELFAAIKGEKDITPEMYQSLKDLFETADFVKFAKHAADEKENAAAVPLAVRFVVDTHESEVAEEQAQTTGEAQ